MATEETRFGFPKGQVAEHLLRILYKNLTPKHAQAMAVVLIGHFMVEDALDTIIFALLIHDMPKTSAGLMKGTKNPVREAKLANEKMRNKLWDEVHGMHSPRKLSLIKPSLMLFYPETVTTLNKINDIRARLAHGKSIMSTKYGSKSIWSDEGLEDYFLDVQVVCRDLVRFHEAIDLPRALAERRVERLKQLGQSVR